MFLELPLNIVSECRAGEVVGRHRWVDLLIAIMQLLVLVPNRRLLVIATALLILGELRVPDLHQRASQVYKIYSR